MKSGVDIIIVNWNSDDLLLKCIERILSSTFFSPFYIIVVDNASTDSSIEILPSDDRIKIYRETVNGGFAKACNTGLQFSEHEFVLLLNPDVFVLDDTLDKSFNFMLANPEYSVLGIQLLNDQQTISRHCNRYPKPFHFTNASLKLSSIFPSVFMDKVMFDWNHKESREVDHVIGAYMMIRRSLIEKIGFMDERYFVYLEDLDFSVRARNMGALIYYNASIQAYHEGGGISKQVKARRLFYANQSVIEFSGKHFSRRSKSIIKFITLFVEPIIRTGFALVTLNIPAVKETIEAYRLLYLKNLN